MLNKQGPEKIDWTDWTWNPISGCRHGCAYCYIKKMDERFSRNMMEFAIHADRFGDIEKSRKLKSGHKVFIGSSGDMFGEWVPPVYIQNVIDVTKQNKNIIFQFLTKNPKRYNEFDFPKNCWLGITIDCQSREVVTEIPAKGNIIFISFEPLLEEFVFHKWSCIDWLIIGANSNLGAEKPKVEWAEKLVSSARMNNLPVWTKNNYKGLVRIKEFPNVEATK